MTKTGFPGVRHSMSNALLWASLPTLLTLLRHQAFWLQVVWDIRSRWECTLLSFTADCVFFFDQILTVLLYFGVFANLTLDRQSPNEINCAFSVKTTDSWQEELGFLSSAFELCALEFVVYVTASRFSFNVRHFIVRHFQSFCQHLSPLFDTSLWHQSNTTRCHLYRLYIASLLPKSA